MNKQHTLKVAGRLIAYSVNFSGKARRLSLRISPATGLIVVVPKQLESTGIDLEVLIKSKAGWLLRKLDHIAKVRSVTPKRTFTYGSKFNLVGKQISLRVVQSTTRRATTSLEGDRLIVAGMAFEESEIRDMVVAWYKHSAKQIVPKRVEQLNALNNFSYKNVVVRDQSSRWGSCSRRGTLSFNWRLLLVPPSVMDYLIYHELAHLKEMNHSHRFWCLVQELCPSYIESEQWLRINGSAMFW